jgi:proton-translocating NADH-quinone oxidoreductase chain N
MAFLYGMVGSLNFASFVVALSGMDLTPWMMVLFSFLLVGFGVKAAIFPVHTWLPDAHPEAPSPVSALLSGVVIETGLYGLIRILFLVFDPSFFKMPIALLAFLTMTVANLSALRQKDIKRLLAFSSIAQIGYMLVGLAAGTTYGVMGLLLHVFNHSLMKGVAFLSAGSLIHHADTRDIDELRGIGRTMPLTSFTLMVAVLGLGGIPPLNGFISKFIIFNSAIGTGLIWLTVAGVLNSTLSMGYYLIVVRNLLAKPEEDHGIHEAPLPMLVVTLFMAVLIIFFGIWPQPVIQFADKAAIGLVENVVDYVSAIFIP